MNTVQSNENMQPLASTRVGDTKKAMKRLVAPLKNIVCLDAAKKPFIKDSVHFKPYQAKFARMTAVEQMAFVQALGEANRGAEMLVLERFLDTNKTYEAVRFPRTLARRLKEHVPMGGLLCYLNNYPEGKLIYALPNALAYRKVQKVLLVEAHRRSSHSQPLGLLQVCAISPFCRAG